MKVRPLIVLALALMCAVLAVFLARNWILGQSSQSAPEVVQTQVCRDQEEVLTTGEDWKQAMMEKGRR